MTNKLEKGYIHLYTGDGKGKTTAAFGLAVRALCAGKSVFIGQFVKNQAYSETALAASFEQLKIEQLGKGCFLNRAPNEADEQAASQGLDYCFEKMAEYDMVILDELTIALYYKLIDLAPLINRLKQKPSNVEVVITGRGAPEELIAVADLVTEMREVKHYYQQGVLSRKGIDV